MHLRMLCTVCMCMSANVHGSVCMYVSTTTTNDINNRSNNNDERISRAPFYVKLAQLSSTGANTKIQNTCI